VDSSVEPHCPDLPSSRRPRFASPETLPQRAERTEVPLLFTQPSCSSLSGINQHGFTCGPLHPRDNFVVSPPREKGIAMELGTNAYFFTAILISPAARSTSADPEPNLHDLQTGSETLRSTISSPFVSRHHRFQCRTLPGFSIEQLTCSVGHPFGQSDGRLE
jgi:hypothetical protein